MRTRTLAGERLARARRALFLCVFCAGCGDDPPFLGLHTLCGARAEDLCAARVGCCDAEDQAACQQREAAACDLALAALEAEALSYDAAAAVRTRGSERTALDACGPVPALSSYFTGGLALGAACARDAQCATGRCAGESRTCVEAASRALCSAP